MNRRPGAVPNLPSSSVGSHAAPLRTASPYENPYGDVQTSQFAGGGMHQRTAADLEEQNDSRLDALSERIKMLKENDVFANASALLGSTFTRMNAMARRQRGWYCNMMLFLLLVIWIFVFLWWWRR